jgi:hypothetical protein
VTGAVALGILLAHLAGDYILQSDWMANAKTSRWWPAVCHAVTYGLPFLIFVRSPWALLAIVGTHAVIDRYRLARHVVWLKNWMAPRGSNRPWAQCKATGYDPDKPLWMTVWLMIVADNTLHLVINTASVMWL